MSLEKTEVSDDATIMAKTEKRSVPRQTAKNRKQNVEELPQAADVSQAVESNTTSVQPAPPRRGRGRKAVQNEPPTAAAGKHFQILFYCTSMLSVKR